MDKIRIILADSEYLIRVGLRALIEDHPHFEIVGEAIDEKDLLEQLPDLNASIVILDYNQPGHFSIPLISTIKKITPTANVLVISADNDKKNIYEVLENGANSFLTKACDEEEIISAIKAAARGEKFFCNKILNYILERTFPEGEEDCSPTPLSQRECEVVQLVAQGKIAKEIASELNLSTHTVYTHRKNIMKKLGLGSASELVIYAMKTGIISAAK